MISLSIKCSEESEWLQRILLQEGIPFTKDASVSSHIQQIAAEFKHIPQNPVSGTILTNHKALAKYLGSRVQLQKASVFESDLGRGHAFTKIFTLDTDSFDSVEFGHHLDSRGLILAGSGIKFVNMSEHKFISFPWDMSRLPEELTNTPLYIERYTDQQTVFTEVAPAVDDGFIRTNVFAALQRAFAGTGLPLVRVAPKINGPGYVAIRIDADGYSPASTRAVDDLSRRHGTPFSWFLDTISWGRESDVITRLAENNEVSLHCHFHMSFLSNSSNHKNMQRGSDFLRSLGLEPRGFVSPFGHTNVSLRDAISRFGFVYSSEFSHSLDCLPSVHPTKKDDVVIQIPTIPSSIGVWESDQNYWSYLTEEIERRISKTGFAVAYDHPLGRLEFQVANLDQLITTLKSQGVTFVSMETLAKMHLSKPKITEAYWDEGKIKYTLDDEDSELFNVEIVQGENEVSSGFALVPMLNRDDIRFRKKLLRSLFYSVLSALPLSVHILWRDVRNIVLRVPERGSE